MVDDLLRQHALELSQLDAIAFGRGPGSFTGLRISAAVVQGLAFGTGLPVLGVSSLAAMAQGLYEQSAADAGALALVCMDARMGEVYFGCYSRSGDGVALCGEEILLRPADLQLSPVLANSKTAVMLGSGWKYRELMPGFSISGLASPVLEALPQARHIAQLGKLMWQRGDVISAEQVEPVYLREQVAWKKAGHKASGEQ
jgi:tRNA threonylcarbamoyladenosine biosynthesis protein TsaB